MNETCIINIHEKLYNIKITLTRYFQEWNYLKISNKKKEINLNLL